MNSDFSFNSISINDLKNLKFEDIQNTELKNFINIFNATNETFNRNQNKNLKSLFNTLKEFAGADDVLSIEELDNFLSSNEHLSNYYDSENVMNLLSNARNASTIRASQEQLQTMSIRAFGHQAVSFRLENGTKVEITEIFDENFKKTKEIRRISSDPEIVEVIYFNNEGQKELTNRTIESVPPEHETETYSYTEQGIITHTKTNYYTDADLTEIDHTVTHIQNVNNEGKIIQEQEYINDTLREQIDYNYETNEIIKTTNILTDVNQQTLYYYSLDTDIKENPSSYTKSIVIYDGKEYIAEYDGKGNTYVVVQNGENLISTIYGNNRQGAIQELAKTNGISEEELKKNLEARKNGEYVLFPWEKVGKRVLIPGQYDSLDPILVNRKGSTENIKSYNDAMNELYKAYGCDNFVTYQGNYGLILEDSHTYNELALELMRAEVSQDNEKVLEWWETNLRAFVNGERHQGLLINEHLFKIMIKETANSMLGRNYKNYNEVSNLDREKACNIILEHLKNHINSGANVSHRITASDIIRKNYNPEFVKGELVSYQSTQWDEAFYLCICNSNSKDSSITFDFGIMRSMVAAEEKFNQGLIEKRALDIRQLLNAQGITNPLDVEYWETALTTTLDNALELRDLDEQIVLDESNEQYEERCRESQETLEEMKRIGNRVKQYIFNYYESNINASRDSEIRNYIDELSGYSIYCLFLAEQDRNYGVIDTILNEGWFGHDDNNNIIIEKLVNNLKGFAKTNGVSKDILNKYTPNYENNVDVKRYIAWIQSLIVAAEQKTDGIELTEEEAMSMFVNHYDTIINGIDNEGEENDVIGARARLNETKNEYCGITKVVQDFFADDGAGYFAVMQNANNKFELFDNLKSVAESIENAETADAAEAAVAEFKRIYKEITGADFNLETFMQAQSSINHYQEVLTYNAMIDLYDNHMQMVLNADNYETAFNNLIDQLYNENLGISKEEFKNQIYAGMLSYNFGLDTERFNNLTDNQKKRALYGFLEQSRDLYIIEKNNSLGNQTLEELGAEVARCLEATCGPEGNINIDIGELESSMQNTSMTLTMIGEIALTIALSFVPGGVAAALGRLSTLVARIPSLIKVANTIAKIGQGIQKINNLRASSNLFVRTVSNGTTVGLSDAGAQYICEGKVDWTRSLKSGVFGGLGCINQALVAEIFPNAGYWTSELLQTGFNSADAFVIETLTGAGYGTVDFTMDVFMDIAMAKLGASFNKSESSEVKIEDIRDNYGRKIGTSKTSVNSDGNIEMLVYDLNSNAISKTVVTKNADGTNSFKTENDDGTVTSGILNEDGSVSNVSRTIIGRDGNPVKIEIDQNGSLVINDNPTAPRSADNEVATTSIREITVNDVLDGGRYSDVELEACIRGITNIDDANRLHSALRSQGRLNNDPVMQQLMNKITELNTNVKVETITSKVNTNTNKASLKISEDVLKRGTKCLAPEGTREATEIENIVKESAVIIKTKEEALSLFKKQYDNNWNKDGILILNPSNSEKANNGISGTSNSYMCDWYAEANGLNKNNICNRENIKSLIESKKEQGCKKVIIVVPDDFAGSGRSMIVDTATTINDLNLGDDIQIELVYSPLLATPMAKTGFDHTVSMNLTDLQNDNILSVGGKVSDIDIMTRFFDNCKKHNIEITFSNEIIEVLPYYQTPTFQNLKSTDEVLAGAVETILTNSGTRKGYGREGSFGTIVIVPGNDGRLKTPNNNTYGAAPYALASGVPPEKIKRPDSKIQVKKWINQMKKISADIGVNNK